MLSGMTRISVRKPALACLVLAAPAPAARIRAQDAPPEAKPAQPEEVRGLKLRDPAATDGLTIIQPMRSKMVHLVDMDGSVVHTWETGFVPGEWLHLLVNGNLLRAGHKDEKTRFHGGGIGGVIQEITWEGKVVWEYELATDEMRLHHDFDVLPNGNLLAIAWENHPRDEAVARGRDEDKTYEAEGFWPDVVLELKPIRPRGAQIVWTWRAWDHLVQDRDPKKPDYAALRDRPGRIDINADHRYRKKEETPEERKKRLELEAEMKKVGYTGGDEDDAQKNSTRNAPSKDAPPRDAPPGDAPPQDAPHQDAPPRDAPPRDAPPRDAPPRDAPPRDAPPRDAPPRDAPPRDAPPRDAPPRDAPPRDAPKDPGAPRQLPRGPERSGDFMHTNCVDYHPREDLIVLSSPHLCELFVIDHSTTTAEAATSSGGRRGKGGDLLWRWGNPQNYGMGTEADRRAFYQHEPSWVAGATREELRLVYFNNGQRRPGKEFSSVEDLVLPFTTENGFVRREGRPFGPEAPAWIYSEPENFFSAFISGAQRFTNGNTLICEGKDGRVFEVTKEGRIVWDYLNPHGGEVEPSPQGGKAPPKALFRAVRIPRSHPAFRGKVR